MNQGYFVGCITGTSVDGLDLALVRVTDDGLDIEQSNTVPLPAELRARLLNLGQVELVSLEEVGQCDVLLGDFIGESIRTSLESWNINADDITAIGSHGQTIRHRPDPHPNAPAFTHQIGDPSRITEQTGITTVADFRRRDMAAGGQGAPLVPPFHRAMFEHLKRSPVIVNIGGISNVSILDPVVSGFDTGPGNALMDAWCERHQQRPFDENGAWAATGRVVPDLLDQFLADPYFDRPPPKSTGREYFNLLWLDRQLEAFQTSHAGKQGGIATVAPADVQATLVELTARSIVEALEKTAIHFEQLIIVGGGRLNPALMQSLQQLTQHTQCDVLSSEDVGAEGDGIEAAAFAWLAAQTLWGLPGNEPAVTGARGPRILGAIYPK